MQIVIDPRQHTINTTGAVRVVLRAPGVGDITLYHQALHVSLQGSLDTSGHTLFNFDTATASTLKGFPFDTSIDVQIQHDAVVIPVSLKLPAYMGGVTGQATLQADNANGLKLSSLQIGVPDLVLGALEVKDLNIDYAATGNVWTGSATVNIPAGTPYFGDRRGRPLRRRRFHDGLVRRQRAVPGRADLHRYLPRRLRRRL